jgi:L-lactate utilization protein LutB
VRLIQDNLNTHTAGAFYEAFDATTARRLVQRLEFHYTPKHASWLNMAELEFSALVRQCLDRRIGSIEALAHEVANWEAERNARGVRIHWSFTVQDARDKLRRHYDRIFAKN